MTNTFTNDYQCFGFKLTADGAQYKLWKQIMDANIKTWIYNTCDHHLLQIVFEENCNAQELLASIDEFFLNSKRVRSIQIQEMFRTAKKGDRNIFDFCHALKNLCDALNDLDTPISETELVMQILRQLPQSYHTVVDIITNTKPFPNFDEAKNMLLVHELRETYTEHVSNPVLHSDTSSNGNNRRKQKQKGKKNMGRGAFEEGNTNEFGGSDNVFPGNQHGSQVQNQTSNGQHSQQVFYSNTPQRPSPSPPPVRHVQPPLAAYPPRADASFGGQQQVRQRLPNMLPSQPHFTAPAQQFHPAFSPQHAQHLGSQSYQFEPQYKQQNNSFNQFGQHQFWQENVAEHSPYGSQSFGHAFVQPTSQPTDSAISQMSLRPPNADPNMDTGSSSHISDKSEKIVDGNSDVLPVTHTDTTKMIFQGDIIYSRTFSEVEKATEELLKFVETKYKDGDRAVIGLDAEWKPTFRKGDKQSKAAVLQICADSTSCHVMHIIHSGFPQNLHNLLGNTNILKVGVGIVGDARKIFRDHNVSIEALEDLSRLANKKFGGKPKTWGLASLTEKLTCKQVPKPMKITLGNWEVNPLSSKQLEYAATDAYVSLLLFEALNRLPDADILTSEAVDAVVPS